MNVNIDLRNLQEQVGENGDQVRKYAHKAALAYTGLWAMAYDSAKSGLEGSKELLDKAEKRGEEVETELSKQYSKYYEQAMQEFQKLKGRAGEVVDRKAANPTLNQASVDACFDRFDGLRHAKGSVGAPELRLEMQQAMQADAAVFRTDKTLAEGVKKMTKIAGKMDDLFVTDRSMVWNSDLMETLELTNLMPNALAKIVGAEARK